MSRTLDRHGPGALLARPGVQAALAALAAPGAESRLVGGCVRDALLGFAAADIDLATTLLPAEVMDRAAAAGIKAIPTGIAHGTVTLLAGGEPIEVTTLREDVETDGRHAIVRFGHDFARDAERRDFTMNALSLGADGQLHDTVGGLGDLAAGHVRFIGEPGIRIREDALRILRFFRFHARFGDGPPDRAALAACIAARDCLDGLSRERVRSEFLKLLLARDAVPVTALLAATGLLQRITGGVGEAGRLGRSVAAGQGAALRLAALCVFTVADAERLQDRLRLSKAEAAHLHAYGLILAALRSLDPPLDAKAIRALAADHGVGTIVDALAILDGEPRPRVTDSARAELSRMVGGGDEPVFPLVGADLVKAGIPPGPAIGRGLRAARGAWLAQGCPVDEGTRDGLLARALVAAREA